MHKPITQNLIQHASEYALPSQKILVPSPLYHQVLLTHALLPE